MIVVSMALISSRLIHLSRILRCLERQTVPPDKVLFHYSSEPCHHDSGIKNLVLPSSTLDIEAVKVPNVGSSRKYLFSADRYRNTNASILLLDDDLLWDRRLVEILRDHQNKFRRVVGTRGWSTFRIVEENGNKVFQRNMSDTVKCNLIYKLKEVLVTSSGWATMFYASDVDPAMFDPHLQKDVMLKYSDEIFLAAMIPHEKFVVPMPRNFRKQLNTESALCRNPLTLRAKALQAELLLERMTIKNRSREI